MARHRRRNVDTQEECERIIEAAARLQRVIPEGVLVGGSASALHCNHRFSADDDHVVRDLVSHYDEVVARLEAEAGWVTNELAPPVMILGDFIGVQTGIRNLIRREPLETTTYDSPYGDIVLPTLREMVRIKGYLFVRRNATRDLVDFIALADHLIELEGSDALREALMPLDDMYPQRNGQSVTRQLALQLAEPKPMDLRRGGMEQYRVLDDRYRSWEQLTKRALEVGAEIERYRLEGFKKRERMNGDVYGETEKNTRKQNVPRSSHQGEPR